MHNINEDGVSTPDVKAIFKKAVDIRANPGSFRKWFKGLRKDTVELTDLQQAWKDADFPDDIEEIERILQEFGYGKSEIRKVFSDVFGDDGENTEPVATEEIIKLAKYIKKNNLDSNIIKYMKDTYGFTINESRVGKVVVEDIKEIFTAIIKEQRLNRDILLNEEERKRLGRRRK